MSALNTTVRTATVAALDAFAGSPGIYGNGGEAEGDETKITDLIANLLHLADERGLEGDRVLSLAAEYYEDELED